MVSFWSWLGLAGALLCAAVPARAEPWQARAAFGGEVGPSAFGIADLGLRKGPLSIQLFTDTLDVRYERELSRQRFFVAARVELLAAGLLIYPFRDGGPDLGRALFASYAGVEGGWVRYLPASFYAGLFGGARVYLFFGTPSTKIEVPGPAVVLTADGVLGRYAEDLHVWLRAGADVQLGSVAPHIAGEAVYRPVAPLWSVAPRLELRAGWAMNQDYLTRTRLGGMNPYVVPLAGAAWAEWWVESYAATRLGFSVRLPMPRRPAGYLDASLVADVATFDGGFVHGFALLGKARHKRLFAEVALGYAPWIPRQEGVSRVSLFVLCGGDWGELRRRQRASPR